MNKKEIKPSVNGNANQSGVPPGNNAGEEMAYLNRLIRLFFSPIDILNAEKRKEVSTCLN